MLPDRNSPSWEWGNEMRWRSRQEIQQQPGLGLGIIVELQAMKVAVVALEQG